MFLYSYSRKVKDYHLVPPRSTRTRLMVDQPRCLQFPGSGEVPSPGDTTYTAVPEVPSLFWSCGWLAPSSFCPWVPPFCKVPSPGMNTDCSVIGLHCHPHPLIQPSTHLNRKSLPLHAWRPPFWVVHHFMAGRYNFVKRCNQQVFILSCHWLKVVS